MSQRINTIGLLHDQIRLYTKNPTLCIDATAGNGKDTLFLADLVGENGNVISMDIQQDAIDHSRVLLEENGLYERVKFVKDGHESMDRYAKEGSVDCITFNLGYLPGGNHAISTTAETTITAIDKGLRLLKSGGIISLAIYQGGDTGFTEKNAVLTYLKTLDCKKYTVLVTDFFNRPNYPPLSVFVLKE